jgi:RES domain-containing protein
MRSSDIMILALITGVVLYPWLAAHTLQVATRNRLRVVERKLDALLQYHGINVPSPLSPEVQKLAANPRQKIAAIKLHRQEHPGLSLAKAKAEVEEFGGEQ